MGCKECRKETVQYMDRPCTVCDLLRNDRAVKRTHYCRMCNAYICDSCDSSLIDRTIAMLKVRFGKK